MKIGIIGAGFTGLSAAYTLLKQGHTVTIFEKDTYPGGLAVGYQEKQWAWTLEKHYHHWFTNDKFVLDLAKEINYPVLIKRPKTSVFVDNTIVQLDSPKAFLTFSKLPLLDRVRMSATLGSLRLNPYWKPLEKVRALDILPKMMGEKAWNMLWNTQLTNKMGAYAKDISLVWFWTRINKRTPSLAYPEGGFLSFANALVKAIEEKGGIVHFGAETSNITDKKKTTITYKKNGKEISESFDKIIVTLPSYLFLKLAPELPDTYRNKLVRLKGLSATNMVLRLKKPFLTDGTYWLSICKQNAPIMAIIEHTNFMDKKNYNNEHLLYIGNYATTHDKLDWDKKKLLAFYDHFLQKIHPGYEKDLIDYELFKAPFAQPIVPINYSKLVPSHTTPLPNVFLANIEQVYPWDRGTNYAVELGENIAHIVSPSPTHI
jgi:protoporphyrinogen oxidase